MIHVICADDEMFLLEELVNTVKTVLGSQTEIVAFSKGNNLMQYIPKEPVDIAFLDINMRGTSGIDVAKRLISLNPKVNIIFCTGYSEYALDALDMYCSGYIMKPISIEKVKESIKNLRYPFALKKQIKFKCFGNFEVYYRNRPIHFTYKKTKEMLAYLVDRNGAMCEKRDILVNIFEDDSHSAYVDKLRKDLLYTLKELGCSDVVMLQKGAMAIDKSKVDCDYYDYLDKKPGSDHLFHGEYMSQYSFAEATVL